MEINSPSPAPNGLRKSIGPGILLAGACIGGSHLMSSTTAGARFGFALVGLILLTNLVKYPFLRVGTRFTSATGLSLLEGFQRRNSAYLPLYLLVSLVTGTATIAAVSFVAGLLLTNIPGLAGQDPYGLSIGVLVVSGLVLLLGHYRALDRLSKLLVVLLTLLTGVAAVSLLIRGPVGEVAVSWVSTSSSPWTLANLAFLIPLMGWMPGPVEMCVWPSLWMFSRADVVRDPWRLHDVRQWRRHARWKRCVVCAEIDHALHRSNGWLGGLGDHPSGLFGHVQHHPHLP